MGNSTPLIKEEGEIVSFVVVGMRYMNAKGQPAAMEYLILGIMNIPPDVVFNKLIIQGLMLVVIIQLFLQAGLRSSVVDRHPTIPNHKFVVVVIRYLSEDTMLGVVVTKYTIITGTYAVMDRFSKILLQPIVAVETRHTILGNTPVVMPVSQNSAPVH